MSAIFELTAATLTTTFFTLDLLRLEQWHRPEEASPHLAAAAPSSTELNRRFNGNEERGGLPDDATCVIRNPDDEREGCTVTSLSPVKHERSEFAAEMGGEGERVIAAVDSFFSAADPFFLCEL